MARKEPMNPAPPAPAEAPAGAASAPAPSLFTELRRTLRSWPVVAALLILCSVVLMAVFASQLSAIDPLEMDPASRLAMPSAEHPLGTDAFGRDVASRVMHGARVSLVVGLGTALATIAIGLFIGVIAGYFDFAGGIIMRLMDGIMAIPAILLAITLVSVSGAGLLTVMVAIAVPEIPRVVRMVRAVILSARSESYVEAAISLGTPLPTLLLRHLVPNTIAPLIVQGTYIFASAILMEAILSFLGAGVPPERPSWGNVMADGRMYFQMISGLILYPGIVLSLTVLSVNILGDAMRDALDPRMVRKL
ncbi:ABC transporter permease [Piscinibacter sakaiensis]|nr:ABC transporter permease [Piscinibacter sakaiensis]